MRIKGLQTIKCGYKQLQMNYHRTTLTIFQNFDIPLPECNMYHVYFSIYLRLWSFSEDSADEGFTPIILGVFLLTYLQMVVC